MMPWLAAVSVLGVFMAIPLKRQLINVEKLPFPEGIATAETLRSLHTAGAAAMAKARGAAVAGHSSAAGGLLARGIAADGRLARQAAGRASDSGQSSKGMALPEQFPLIPASGPAIS